MAEKKDANHGDEHDTEVRERLANERTLLSWVRTGIGLISLGIVVERAGALVSQTIPGDISELLDRKSTRLNSSHANISYAVFCLKKKKQKPSLSLIAP